LKESDTLREGETLAAIMTTTYSESFKKVNTETQTVPTLSSAILNLNKPAVVKILGEIGFPVVDNIKLKNRNDVPVVSSISGQFIGGDGLTMAKMREYNTDLFNHIQPYRACTGSAAGVMNRMKSAFEDYKPVKFSLADVEETLSIFDYEYTPSLKERINALFDAEHAAQIPMPEMDMETSTGLFYQERSDDKSTTASNTVPKKDIDLDVMIRDAQSILEALTAGKKSFSQLLAKKPAMFALNLRSKEEVIEMEKASTKSRPYFAISYPLNFLASSIFQLIQEGIKLFNRDLDSPSASAYKFTYMLDDEIKMNGGESILAWIHKTKEGVARSICYGDDSLFSWKRGKKVYYSAPDISHLDMSLGPHFARTVNAHITNFFIKGGISVSTYNKSWVKRFVDFYSSFCFHHLVLGPGNIIFDKDKGFASGLPGTTIIDMFCMSHFHVGVRKNLNLKMDHDAAMLAAANTCGFKIKPETLIFKEFDIHSGETSLPFLGATIQRYTYDLPPYVTACVPLYDKHKLARSLVYSTTMVSKAERQILQIARLLGLSLVTFNQKDLFTIVCATISSSQAGFKQLKLDPLLPRVSRYTVSIQERQYIEKYIGKPLSEIKIPTVLPILRFFTVFEMPVNFVVPVSKEEAAIINTQALSMYNDIFEEEDDLLEETTPLSNTSAFFERSDFSKGKEQEEEEDDSDEVYVLNEKHVLDTKDYISNFSSVLGKDVEQHTTDAPRKDTRKVLQTLVEQVSPTVVHTSIPPAFKLAHTTGSSAGFKEALKSDEQSPELMSDENLEKETLKLVSRDYPDFIKVLGYVNLKNKYKDPELTHFVDLLLSICKIDFALMRPPFPRESLTKEELAYFDTGLNMISEQVLKMKITLYAKIEAKLKSLSNLPALQSFLDKMKNELDVIAKKISWGDTINTENLANLPKPETIPKPVEKVVKQTEILRPVKNVPRGQGTPRARRRGKR